MPLEGRRLTIGRALALCYEAGFRRRALNRAVAVMCAESARYVRAYNINLGPPVSIDRGLFQVNSRAHPELSEADAFKARPNIAFAFQLSNEGRNWSPWAAYDSGRYLLFMPIVMLVRSMRRWKRLVEV